MPARDAITNPKSDIIRSLIRREPHGVELLPSTDAFTSRDVLPTRGGRRPVGERCARADIHRRHLPPATLTITVREARRAPRQASRWSRAVLRSSVVAVMGRAWRGYHAVRRIRPRSPEAHTEDPLNSRVPDSRSVVAHRVLVVEVPPEWLLELPNLRADQRPWSTAWTRAFMSEEEHVVVVTPLRYALFRHQQSICGTVPHLEHDAER